MKLDALVSWFGGVTPATSARRIDPVVAIADIIETTCSGVTPTSCPIAIEPIDDAAQRPGMRTSPRVSPGNPRWSVDPKPYNCMCL